MEIRGELCTIRPYRETDIPRIVALANNRKVWRNLKDIFPHPYTQADAEWWIEYVAGQGNPPHDLAIEVEGRYAGGVGCKILGDVYARCREIGYWIGEPYWGQGIVTEAVGLWTEYLFEHPEIHRCQAYVFGWNPASARVLEKNGYAFEGRLRDGIYKDGAFTDALYYGRLREK